MVEVCWLGNHPRLIAPVCVPAGVRTAGHGTFSYGAPPVEIFMEARTTKGRNSSGPPVVNCDRPAALHPFCLNPLRARLRGGAGGGRMHCNVFLGRHSACQKNPLASVFHHRA